MAGTPGAALDARLRRVSDDVFTKQRSDAFSNPELERFLSARRVDRLYLCGIDGAHCVLATARGGRNRGYKVTLLEDCVDVRPGKKLVSSYIHYLRAKVDFSSFRQMRSSDPEVQKLL
ncbi:cysteine hydrolase [bacterium]|nr:cysteine hydrolase [bacterium]